jgi:RimJ/RimL family protein N-acetyltransferase
VSATPTSPRIRFRRMEDGDLDDMARLLGDPDVMTHYPRPRTREEAAAWIRWNQDNYARDGFGLWILHDREGNFLGDCGLTWQRVNGVERLELGYHLVPQWQGRGLATEAARASCELARSRGMSEVIALVVPENLPSRRVAERLGLTVESEDVTSAGIKRVVYAAAL